jgi:hypothetical protein
MFRPEPTPDFAAFKLRTEIIDNIIQDAGIDYYKQMLMLVMLTEWVLRRAKDTYPGDEGLELFTRLLVDWHNDTL